MTSYLNQEGDYEYNEDLDRYEMPADFDYYYFAVREEDDPWGSKSKATVVYFCPSEYFDQSGYMWDQYSPMEDRLPRLFSEAYEGTYTFKGTVEEAQATCEALGMRTNAKFSKIVEYDGG